MRSLRGCDCRNKNVQCPPKLDGATQWGSNEKSNNSVQQYWVGMFLSLQEHSGTKVTHQTTYVEASRLQCDLKDRKAL